MEESAWNQKWGVLSELRLKQAYILGIEKWEDQTYMKVQNCDQNQIPNNCKFAVWQNDKFF